MTILEIRVGKTQDPEYYTSQDIAWPEKVYSSAYLKPSVSEVQVDDEGLVGNEIGFPTHLEYKKYRAALVFNLLQIPLFEELIPSCAGRLHSGSFGENFTVDLPELMPSVVCIGDKFRVGSALFVVSCPRHPCPKVDAVCGASGITRLAAQHGWAGYFLMVLQPGAVRVGDRMELLDRPYPGYTVQRVSEGLWGPPEMQNKSRDFLTTLTGMEMLVPRHYGDVARSRLERLDKESE